MAMANNIMTDQAIVIKAIAYNQEVIDAFDRLVEYSNTLEVQVGCYEDFIDEISWEGAIGVVDQQTVEALRGDVAVAQRGVEDNYGLLEIRQGTVETVQKQCVDIDLTPTSRVSENIKAFSKEIKERIERL